ncbi:MAG: DUF3783 domain-containing protein [Candidatus Thermoplasmatota archaeon]|nr:DUF3783 domain-containing protein [Candidatus Thermoplasmatota archaeon]
MTDRENRKIIIVHNFDKGEYIDVLKVLESTGLAKKTIVARTTPTTMNWKLKDLIAELFLEDEEIKKNR